MTSQPLDCQQLAQMSDQQRFEYFVEQSVINKEIWLLTDEHGCVMLNTEDEDCVPVWPSLEAAEAWATDEWQDCEAQPIALKTWQMRWSDGLEEDGFFVVVCPMGEQEGLVVDPQDLAKELTKAIKKQNRKK